MEITKSDMVIMKGKKIGKLYKLLENTMTGVAVVSTSAEPDSDGIVLWHMRLGHLGELNMFDFHKWNLLKGVKPCKLDFCKCSIYEKQRRVNFKVVSHTSKSVLEKVWFC